MKNKEEQKMFDMIDQLKHDDIKGSLSDIEFEPSQKVSPKALARIKKASYRTAGIQPLKHKRLSFYSLRTAVALVLLTLFIGGAIVGPEQVWAGIQRTLNFIPGFGMVVEGEGQRYVLNASVSYEVKGTTYTVTGVMADEQRTLVMISCVYAQQYTSTHKAQTKHRDALLKSLYVEETDGTRYEAQSYSIHAGYGWKGTFAFAPLKHKDNFTIGFHDSILDQAISFALDLKEATSYESYAALGPTVTANDISITAVTSLGEDRLDITLVGPPLKQGRISSYLHQQMTLTDVDGKGYVMEHDLSYSPPLSSYSFDIFEAEGEMAMLYVPEILVKFNTTEKVKIAIPKEGEEVLNKTISLAGHPVHLTSIERLPANRVRISVDLNYSSSALRTLQTFSLDAMRLPFNSWAANINEATGVYESMEFEVKSTDRSITLYFQNPEVLFRGPWTFEIPLK